MIFYTGMCLKNVIGDELYWLFLEGFIVRRCVAISLRRWIVSILEADICCGHVARHIVKNIMNLDVAKR
jgi:hypothetical protein